MSNGVVVYIEAECNLDGIFVVVEDTNTDNIALIKMMPSQYGEYYNIDTVGYYRKSKWKESEEVIADLSEPSQSDAVTNASKL